MSQSTKLFVTIGLLWLVYTTLKGHLANYLQLVFAECNASAAPNGPGGSDGSIFGAVTKTVGGVTGLSTDPAASFTNPVTGLLGNGGGGQTSNAYASQFIAPG